MVAVPVVHAVAQAFGYDPLMRLYQTVSGASTSRFLYDGLDGIAEYNSANALQRRWVFDPTTSEPVIWFEGTGTAATNRRYLSADERGSIISVSDSTGASLGINAYDEYGIPKSPLTGRYGYTGQAWIPSAQLWYYKARVYHPQLGRFLQPDPIGYAGSPNLYAYVLNDPINLVDPLGLQGCPGEQPNTYLSYDGSGGAGGGDCGEIVVTGIRVPQALPPSISRAPPGPGGSRKPQPKPNRTPESKAEKTKEKEACRGAVTAGFVGILSGLSLGEARHLITGAEDVGRTAGEMGYFRGAARGAAAGARFGPWGAAGGAVTMFGLLYAWDRHHEEVMAIFCGE